MKDDHLLVIHRNKFGKEYYTLPGGRIELGESPEEAIRRELKEETMLDVGESRLVLVEEAGDPYGTQYVYLCEYLGGEPELSVDSEEAIINKLGQNLHEPLWMPTADLPEKPFVSEQLKEKVIKGLQEGFPENAETFTTA